MTQYKALNNRLLKIEIVNAVGQVIVTENSELNRFTFNIQHYAAGIYFIKIIEQNKVIALEKIIKD
jgi:predicted site-specific integrase-resolvase